MTDEDLIALVQEYFASVDSQDIDRVMSTLSIVLIAKEIDTMLDFWRERDVSLSRELARRQVTEARVRPHYVIVSAPSLGDNL
jgi:hypothetical protein